MTSADGKPPSTPDDIRVGLAHLVAFRQRHRGIDSRLREVAKVLNDAVGAFAKWFEQNRGPLEQFLETARAFEQIRPEAERKLSIARAMGYDHLLEIDWGHGLVLMFAIDEDDTEALESLLEEALGSEPFIEELLEILRHSELPDAQRIQLIAGVGAVRERKYEVAVPLLLIALEGLIWLHARDRNLVARTKGGKMTFTEAAGEKRAGDNAHSVDALFDLVGVDDTFRRYLVRNVYGSEGNPYRHGNAETGWRYRALATLVALVSWLDLRAGSTGTALLAHAFRVSDPDR